jgi:hypothetical protein
MSETRSLGELQREFLAYSTISMPLAGAIVWAGIGVAALWLSPGQTGTLAVYAMALLLPLAFALDRLRGRNPFAKPPAPNPLSTLFFRSIIGIGLLFPFVIGAASALKDPTVVVLGVAILAGLIWIPYGWAADDPVGLQHAIGRAILCYVAGNLAPEPYRASAVCAAVVLAYVWSLARMRRPGAMPAEARA